MENVRSMIEIKGLGISSEAYGKVFQYNHIRGSVRVLIGMGVSDVVWHGIGERVNLDVRDKLRL